MSEEQQDNARANEPSSWDLLRSSHAGDGSALELLLARHLDKLHAFVRLQITPDIRAKESSLDLVQSVCREILENPDRFGFRDEAAFKNWLFGAVCNKIRDRQRHYRAQKRAQAREAPLDEGLLQTYAQCSPSAAAMSNELAARLERACTELSPAEREVFGLSRIAGLTNGEIARELDKKEGTIRVTLHRALVKLARLLAEPAEGDPT